MSPKPKFPDEMPSLTIDGKRIIIAKARNVLGEKKLTQFLATHEIPSIQYLTEHVRKVKAKFFRNLHEKTVVESKSSQA